MTSIDKADWHYGADDFPDDVPEENGATHIGCFVRRAIGRGLFVADDGTPVEVIEMMAAKLDERWARFKAGASGP